MWTEELVFVRRGERAILLGRVKNKPSAGNVDFSKRSLECSEKQCPCAVSCRKSSMGKHKDQIQEFFNLRRREGEKYFEPVAMANSKKVVILMFTGGKNTTKMK